MTMQEFISLFEAIRWPLVVLIVGLDFSRALRRRK